MTTGNTLKPTRARFTSTPMMFPQMMPPSADTMPVIAQARPKYRSTLMPMAMATCWLSATARMAMPLRDFTKNQPKPARKIRLTRPPTSWMGGMNRGPSTMGSSGMGRGKGRDPAPNVVGPIPRRMAARPMVAMTTAMTGRPISLRSITRSRAKPKAIMVPRPSADRHPQRRLPDVEGRRHQDARDHHELALGEVDGVGRLVHEHEAERDQRVHEPDEDPVGHQEQEEAEVVRHGRGLLPRPRSGRATGWWPGGRPRT